MALGLQNKLRRQQQAYFDQQLAARQAEESRLQATQIGQNRALLDAMYPDPQLQPQEAARFGALYELPTQQAVAGAQAIMGRRATEEPGYAAAQQQKFIDDQIEREKALADLESKVIANRNLQMTGGRTVENWTADKRKILELGGGLQNVSDLRVMNEAIGREILPGAEKGTYQAKRGYVLNTLRQLFDAGALQQAELEFFQSMIPAWDTWSSFSKAQKDAALRELESTLRLKLQGLVETTQGTVMPETPVRPLFEIMGEPEPPADTVPVEPQMMNRFLEAPAEQARGQQSTAEAFGRIFGGD